MSANKHGLLFPKSVEGNASFLVKSGIGRLRGIFVNASKLGTLELLDNTENAIPVLVREFAVAGDKYYKFGDVAFGNGLYIVVGGTCNFTVFYF
jgi:hypothetical protein